MPRKKKVRITKSLFRELCDHIAQDKSVAQLHRDNPDKYPRPESFSRYVARSKPEVIETYYAARKAQIFVIDDRYNDLLENKPIPTGDKAVDAHTYKVWQTTLLHLEKRLARLGPIFSKEYDKVARAEIDHKGEATQIVIGSFLDPTDIKKPLQERLGDEDKTH